MNILTKATVLLKRAHLTLLSGLRYAAADFRAMKSRFSITLAAAACLVGCNNPSQSPVDSPAATNGSAAMPTASTGGQQSEWKTTATGLKYQVLKRGTGTVSPKPTDTVKVHYHGTLPNGTVFDSSVERGEPISFPLNGVIRGWTEGLQLMKVGDKFKFEIPPNLAYGDASPSPKIPPNSTLVFEVELLAIE
jgi:FKBP-type peptidyl-prolyl cis-trans isomerase